MTERIYNLPDGPALIYVHSDSQGPEIRTTRVDWRPPEAAQVFVGEDPRKAPSMRERAVLRSLLTHALFLLDTADLPE